MSEQEGKDRSNSDYSHEEIHIEQKVQSMEERKTFLASNLSKKQDRKLSQPYMQTPPVSITVVENFDIDEAPRLKPTQVT